MAIDEKLNTQIEMSLKEKIFSEKEIPTEVLFEEASLIFFYSSFSSFTAGATLYLATF